MEVVTPPRIEACYFNNEAGEWGRMARVLDFTARRHCPGWERRIGPIWPTDISTPTGVRAHRVNTQKLIEWNARVQAAADGDRVLLIDADTMIVNPISDIWDRPFDLAYTSKRGARFPLNGGVVFLRISARVKAFVSAWLAENLTMLEQPAAFIPWRRTHGGVNQSSLGSVLASRRADLAVIELPCREWNCEDSAWATFDPAVTRVVHVKSALRRAAIDKWPADAEIQPLATLWRRAEKDATRAEAVGA